jgi:hypothetical protein
MFKFGNIVIFKHYTPHLTPSLPAQTTWSHTEAHEASLPPPPHSDHLVNCQETSFSLAPLALLVKGKHN